MIRNKVTLILVALVSVLIMGGVAVYQKFISSSNQTAVEEVDLSFDSEGPYALLVPRRDGNALVLNLKRTSSYDEITYELAYTSLSSEAVVGEDSTKKKTVPKTDEGESGNSGGYIDRGVQGTIDTKQKKGEYEQEILFGTCSKNVCKYDKGVENGTLTLHIKKGNKAYRMITQWHLQKLDVALGQLSSGDGHLIYKTTAKREDLAVVGYSIINDLTGVPKLPDSKQVMGKVYALNVPLARSMPAGSVSLELAESPSSDANLARYDDAENKWLVLDTKMDGSKLSAKADGGGIFAVLTGRR